MCESRCNSCTSYTNCSSCKDGYYLSSTQSGLELIQDCSQACARNCRTCTSDTQCSSCYNGYYNGESGERCENTCSKGCVSLSCFKETGKCTNGCELGYTGEWCDTCETCFTRIADICTNCSETCEVCSAGNVCTKCKDSYGGTACRIVCPATCRSCVSENTCTECIDGYLGQTCLSTCRKGRWGNQCSSVCPSNCINGDCNHINGSCTLGCKEGYKGDLCNCPSNCECDVAGSCTSCLEGFANVVKLCMCRKDMCVENICTRCSNDSFYVQDGACCPCSSNCKDGVCVSAFNCSLGCKSGYYGNDCTKMCSDIDHWCEECPINYEQTNGLCHQCTSGYYPFKDVTYGYNRCKKYPNKCLDGECDSATGECIKGCVDKQWGLTCQKDCLINCLKCNRSNGNCSVCKGGKYLADCSQSCSASCKTIEGQLLCQIENGACLNGCANLNKYGTHCEHNCSYNCKDNVCSWVTGDCVKGCQENIWGKHCEHVCNDNCKPIGGATSCNESTGHCLAGCIDGYHSVQCDKTCSINCLNTSCDISGKCIHGYSGNFVGDSCLQVKYRSSEKSSGDTATIGWSVGGALALTIIVIVAAIVLLKRRRKTEQNIEDNHGNNTIVYSNMEIRLPNSDTETSVAEGSSTAYEMIARRDDSSQYSTLFCDPNKSAALLDVGSRSSAQVATEKIHTIYEKPILEKDLREYSVLEYDTSQTPDEYSYGHKGKIQHKPLIIGKRMERRDSVDNKTNTGACSFDETAKGADKEEQIDYINTSLAGVSHAKNYP